MTLAELQNMAKGTGGRHTWRLRDLSEENEVSAKESMISGTEHMEEAFNSLHDGNREAALTALRRAIQLAERAIENIEQ